MRSYEMEEQKVKTINGTGKKMMIRFSFANTEGLYEFTLPFSGAKEHEQISGYFDKLFGILKTLVPAMYNWKKRLPPSGVWRLGAARR